MALELKIISPSEEGFVKQIVWNADEIAEYVAGRVGYYKNLVYTDAQIVEAKKDRAELNKFISALKAKDREIKKLCLQPYEEFHQKMQMIIAQVEEPVNLIDKQVKDYEEQQKAAKTEEIKKLFEEKGFQPWVTLDRIWNPSWLNKSYSLKKIEADLSTIQHSIGEDILLINQMGEGQPAALREYQRTMDKTKAAMIITNDAKEISEKIYSQLGRTVTIMEGEGLVSGKKVVLYCVLTRFEIHELKDIIKNIDSSAFIAISDVSEIIGTHIKKTGNLKDKQAKKEEKYKDQEP